MKGSSRASHSHGGACSRRSLFAGLYLPTLNGDGNRDAAVEVARGAGAGGVSFFEMSGLWPRGIGSRP